MGSFSDDALVLNTHPFRDRDLIVTLLTPGHGLVRGVLRRARVGKAPLAAAAQILSLVAIDGYQRPQADLATFRRFDLVRSSFPVSESLDRMAAAAVVAELLAAFCTEHEPAQRHFRLGRSLLEALLAEAPAATVVSYAQFWVLLLGGVLPPLASCAACGRDLEGDIKLRETDGQATCDSCALPSSETVSPDGLRFLASCRRLPIHEVEAHVPEEISRWLDRRVRAEAERSLRALEFYRRNRE